MVSGGNEMSYTPDPYAENDSLTYEVCDNGLPPVLCDSATVYMEILALNNAPDAVEDYAYTFVETPVSIDILANDTDIENDDFMLPEIAVAPENGNAYVEPDRRITYTPYLGYYGTDSLQYHLCDEGLPSYCDFAWVYIDVLELQIPDSFSPNNDGINELWEVAGIENFPDNEVSVFNRWGEIVFEANDYQNDWDGTIADVSLSADGKIPTGTYFYIFKLTQDMEPLTGYLIIRK